MNKRVKTKRGTKSESTTQKKKSTTIKTRQPKAAKQSSNSGSVRSVRNRKR